MSFSFYGGPKGQDFSISRVFNNRSNDLLEDLKMRWYSPVNVGDYVFINYGDIQAQDKYITKSNGEVAKISSLYNQNLNIDLESCGKSYNNSLWQKIYVDENKNITPQFSAQEENIYVFLNIADELERYGNWNGSNFYQITEKIYNQNNILSVSCNDGSGVYTILEKNTNYTIKYIGSQQDGFIASIFINKDFYNPDHQYRVTYKIIKTADIGLSLKESSQIYTEETFGFGYRLIACLTGQTPLIEFKSVARNIEDGEPGIAIDTSILERPKVTFYQQKAQEINKANTTVVSSENEPQVYLDTINKGTRTNPVLEFNLPKATQFFTGMLFGEGSFSIYQSISSLSPNGELQSILRIGDLDNGITSARVIYNRLNSIADNATENFEKRYFNNSSLQDRLNKDSIDVDSLPFNFYGFIKDDDYDNLNVIKAELEDIYNNLSEKKYESVKWGKCGLITKTEFDSLKPDKQSEYINDYLSGYRDKKSFYYLKTFIKNSIPIAYSKEFFTEWNGTASSNSDLENYIIKLYENIILNLKDHYEYLLNNAYLGDYYINIPTGRVYKFLKIDSENILKVQYIGPLAGEAPILKTESIEPFSYDSNNDIVQNQISISTNITDGLASNEDFKEIYTFKIPKIPNFTVGKTEMIGSEENPEVTIIKEPSVEEQGYKFNFGIPQGTKFYHAGPDNDIDINSEEVKNGDYVLYTGGAQQGKLYKKVNGNSNFVTDLRGPAGMAKMAGSIKIIVGCSENSIDPSDDNKVLTAKLNIGANEDIDKILTEILSSIGNFNSWVNQKIDLKSDNLFVVQKFIQDENDEIEFDSSYWSIYHQKKQNIIYGIIENDEFYQFTEYNGAWYIDENLLGDKQTIELVFNPVYSNFIECSLGKNKLLSVTNYNNETNSIEVSLAGIDSNVVNTHGRLIYITYLIKDKVEYLKENVIYHSNGKNYIYSNGILAEGTIEPSISWSSAELAGGGSVSDIDISNSRIDEPDDNDVYSAKYINSLSAQLVWKTLNQFTTQ